MLVFGLRWAAIFGSSRDDGEGKRGLKKGATRLLTVDAMFGFKMHNTE